MKPKVAFFSGVLTGMVLILVILAAAFVIPRRNAMVTTPGKEKGLNFPSAAAFTKTHGEVDADWTVRSINGETLLMEELRGQVVFLNLWATWCGPCIREMPSIEALETQLADDNRIKFMLVTDESVGLVKDALTTFWDGRKLDGMPLYSSQSKRPYAIRTNSLPSTFIIDKQGNIRFVKHGREDWDDPKAAAYLRALADEPA